MTAPGTLGRRIIFSSGGVTVPVGTILQYAHGYVQSGPGATLGAAVTPGSILVAVCYERNGAGGKVSLNASPTTEDTSWTTYEGPGIYSDFNNGAGQTMQAKVATDSFAGPWYTTAIQAGNKGELEVWEIAGVTLTGVQHGSQSKGTASPADAGSFTCGAGDIIVLGVSAGQSSDLGVTPGAFTEVWDAVREAGGLPWAWAGHRIVAAAGSESASVAVTSLAGGNTRLAATAIILPVIPPF